VFRIVFKDLVFKLIQVFVNTLKIIFQLFLSLGEIAYRVRKFIQNFDNAPE
jgi:hypothetical protein